MNTPAHILLGAAVFGRAPARGSMPGALIGSLAPDLSLYLLAGTALFVLRIPAETVFGELYYSTAWQTVFAIDNSIFVWGLILALSLWMHVAWMRACASAALLHIALDGPLHAGDGRPHFWPVSNWVYDSPLSYWDSAHHALWVAPVTLVISGVSFALLWRFTQKWPARLAFGVLMLAELWVARQWLMFF